MCQVNSLPAPDSNPECKGVVDFTNPVLVSSSYHGFACVNCGAMFRHDGTRMATTAFTFEQGPNGAIILCDRKTGHKSMLRTPSVC